MWWLFWLGVSIVLSSVVLSLAFPYVMGINAALKAGLYVPRSELVMARVLFYIGALADFVANATRGWWVFEEPPQWQRGELMLSNRIQRWVDAGPHLGGWRYDLAIKWGYFINFLARTQHIRRLPKGS